MSKVTKKMRKLHKEFVKKHGHTPKYVDVIFNWEGWDAPCHETLKIRDYDKENTENDPDDEEITFYVDGIEGLCELANNSNAEFSIIDVEEFSDYMIW